MRLLYERPYVQTYCIDTLVPTRGTFVIIFARRALDIRKYPKLGKFWGQTSVPLIIGNKKQECREFGLISVIAESP